VNQDIVKIREQLVDSVAECSSKIQAETEVLQTEIQKEIGNLKARFSSRNPERSTSANYANIGQDQIVRVHIIGQG
jgi:hypothetical protein